jgi:hypothetical protein
MNHGGAGASEAARLTALKAEQCRAACNQIRDGDLDQAAAHVRQAELIDRLARLAGNRASPLPFVAMALIGACVLLVFAAWRARLTRFGDLEVSIHAQTTAAQLTLARPATVEAFRGAAVDVGRLDTLEAQISDIPAKPAGNRWVRVQGANVEVRGLHAASESRLALAVVGRRAGGDPTLVLRAYTKGIAGDLLVRPGAVVSAGVANEEAAPRRDLGGDVPDVVSFGCDDCVEAPFRLDLAGVEPFDFGNVPVSKLACADEHAQPDGTVYFTSGLRAGSIRLLDADRTETIERGDNLTLTIAETRRFQIGRSANDDTLSFIFEGTVSAISLGPVGAEKDLSPSLLEFFYRQKALALLWGAAVFLWGCFMGMRKLWHGAPL